MVFYESIDRETEEGRRTAERLLELREALEREIPGRDIAGTLLLATWNIREFDSPSYGARMDEPLYYIAEIIDHFDLVAVQEVRDNLDALERLIPPDVVLTTMLRDARKPRSTGPALR